MNLTELAAQVQGRVLSARSLSEAALVRLQDAHMALLREPDIEHVARAVNERLDELSRNSSSASDAAARSGARAQAGHAGSVRA